MRMRQKGKKMSAKKQSEKRKRSFDGMNSAEFAIKWKRAFAGGVPQAVMQERVDAPGCFLWHVFSWGDAKHLEREAASAAFDKADKAGAFIAQEYSFNGGGKKTEYFSGNARPILAAPTLRERRRCSSSAKILRGRTSLRTKRTAASARISHADPKSEDYRVI